MIVFYISLCALLALTFLWCVQQFRRPRRVWFVGDAKGEVETLSEERQMTLRTLKDLEAEFESGKLADEVYAKLREETMTLAAEQTEKLNALRENQKAIRAKLEAELSGEPAPKAKAEAASKPQNDQSQSGKKSKKRKAKQRS